LTAANGPRATCRTIFIVSSLPRLPFMTIIVDHQLVATDFWTEFDHPTEGRIRMPAIATRFSRTVPEIRRLQPRLGEHSVEVLGEAGFSRLEIDELIAIGATRDGRTV
jgi:crotonobetainyl-CoA:carnitine CoA-transferase CaiB-like acyl-CoA transferase